MPSPSTLEKNLLMPPYRYLPLAVLIVLEVFFFGAVLGHVPLTLADPDDYMRLNQTISWLQGQGWYDLSQPRMSPGAHTVIHWARCIDIPIALLMMPLLDWLGIRSAALTAAMLAPALPFILLLITLPALARPVMGRRWRNLALLFLVAAPMLLGKFKPGAVDHHNWELLIAAVGFWGLQAMLLCREGWCAGIISPIAFAFGLWIGAEIVPVLALTVGCLAVSAAWRGGFALRNMAVFGLSLFLATGVLLPAALPMSAWTDRSISWFSTAYVILTGLVGVALIVGWLLGRCTTNRQLRLALIAALGFQALVLFIALVPDVLAGPFADYDAYNASDALDVIDEAMPFINKLTVHTDKIADWMEAAEKFFTILFAPLIAFVFSCIVAARTRFRQRRFWLIYAIFLGVLLALGLFGQGRVLWYAEILQLPPLAFLTWRWWERCKGWSLWQRYRAVLLSFLLIGLLPVTVIPFALQRISVLSETPKEPTICAGRQAAEFITSTYRGHVETILAGADEGPELLFFTPHNVIAGNFDVPGNRDVVDFFTARDDAKALAIAHKWKAGLVLTCKAIPSFYSTPDKGAQTLIKKLIKGDVPSWLNPVEIPASTGYLLFEVR